MTGNLTLPSDLPPKERWTAPWQGMPAQNTVLIADASVQRRYVLAQILGELPVEIVEAENTKEAISAIAMHQLDLVLVDFDLDGQGATKLCRMLKQATATQLLPVFVISQQDHVEREIQAMEAGANDFLVAPLRPQALRARVQAILRHKIIIDSMDHSETVLLSLAESVEERDSGLGQHCKSLALMASITGLALGLSGQDIVTLQRAAYLHDIGKVSIPDSILFKTGPLTPDEWEVMKSHAERGERICSNMRSLTAVLPVIRHHHEKWDGSGYPDRLKGEQIPLLARILQLTDIYDALTTARCYKPAFTSEEAVAILRAEAQKGWRDPQLTEEFIKLVPRFSSTAMTDLSRLSLCTLAGSVQQARKHSSPKQTNMAIPYQFSNDVISMQ